jgi:hypothetical protein
MMPVREYKTFTFINNEKLCVISEAASRHVIYAAPSIAESVAKALCQFAERNENAALRVIVDANAESFRLGFGEQAGLALLVENILIYAAPKAYASPCSSPIKTLGSIHLRLKLSSSNRPSTSATPFKLALNLPSRFYFPSRPVA